MEENQYVIISKTAIQKRIEELKVLSNKPETSVYDVDVEGFILEELEQLLSQSTPLIPENINKILSTPLGSEEN